MQKLWMARKRINLESYAKLLEQTLGFFTEICLAGGRKGPEGPVRREDAKTQKWGKTLDGPKIMICCELRKIVKTKCRVFHRYFFDTHCKNTKKHFFLREPPFPNFCTFIYF